MSRNLVVYIGAHQHITSHVIQQSTVMVVRCLPKLGRIYRSLSSTLHYVHHRVTLYITEIDCTSQSFFFEAFPKSVPRTLSWSVLQSLLGIVTLPRSISRSISGVRTLPQSFSRSISVSPNIDPSLVCTVKVYLQRGKKLFN